MLELLAIPAGIGLGKFVLTQVLDLSKPVLESYVQDFFKDCLDSGVAQLKVSTLKQPMAEAIGFFIQRFIKELQFCDVPDTSIDHHYKATLKQFVRDKVVCVILGKAFETGCKKIDYAQLKVTWTARYQQSGWQFPTEDFDWRGIAKEYVVQVKGIIKADPELRALLETDLLAEIAQNTAQLSPGFDITAYRNSLQSSYGYLKLYALDSTDRTDSVKIWRMFIEQTVREALPPTRFDLPLDLKRQLQQNGQLETDLSAEALELYRRDYFQQPARKVLEAIADSQHAVILGDPGAGKSTLLQFLALDWVESKTEELPLLIELREYALAQSTSFLDFLHCGRGADWQFDQQRLYQHLSEEPTLVMFDGLDEVFDHPTQATIIDDIIRFAQQYPRARVLVTSRIIGYTPERFQHADFQQFTLQPLDETEIHEFIDRWYDLSMGSNPDKVRLKQRLKDAIANSKAISNLADNPLLLTMMAILNRRQELPRDRVDLYDQASRVLLHHWDVDHKRLNLPMDAIGRREKQEMLGLIAYDMQAGEAGLKGNLISADRLIRILTNYLRDQGFSEPREKASRLIQQLRERNFILCYRGADTYGFMHRTFLEYFCAAEIVHRFEKQRTLTFEQLRDEIFGNHWQDKTWHEVFCLICGEIHIKYACQIVEYMTEQQTTDLQCPEVILATQCFFEIKNRAAAAQTDSLVFRTLVTAFEHLVYVADIHTVMFYETHFQIFDLLKKNWTRDPSFFAFLQENLYPHYSMDSRLYPYIVEELVVHWSDMPETWKLLKTASQSTESSIRHSAILGLGKKCKNDLEILEILKKSTRSDDCITRRNALISLRELWENAEVHEIFRSHAQKDSEASVRNAAFEALKRKLIENDELIEFFKECIISDCFRREFDLEKNPRQTALMILLDCYPKEPEVLQLLQDQATKDPDEQLRQWAQKQLEALEKV